MTGEFEEWVVLGSVDIDDLVSNNCHDVDDWERNFRALKARGRDLEKLPKLVLALFYNTCSVLCVHV